jgi:uncharacterized protein (TIGR03000 family)
MYSLVLMAALSTGPATVPDCHGCHGGCGGCYGCCGCYGGCSGCYGCWGGGYSCCGCWGGGYSCGGCYGGYSDCYGCSGYSCGGSWGGYGYGYGGCQGWTGCYGGWPSAYYSPPVGGPPAVGAPAGGGGEAAPPPVKGGENKKETSATRAKVIVEVPADAKLYIDDQPMKTPSTRRVYSTPDLQPGEAYYYVVRVELVRDGQKQTETKRVILRAGQEVRADFTGMEAVAAVKAEPGLGR